MARRPIREFDAKRLIKEYIKEFKIQDRSILITPETNLEILEKNHPWLTKTKLVAKPDQLFGKRKKHNLVLLDADLEQTTQWIKEHQGKQVTIGKSTDTLTHFLIEPFIPHDTEYYLAFVSERDYDLIHFSSQGGVDIEENWDNVTAIRVPTLQNVENIDFSKITEKQVIKFIQALFKVYKELDFSYLEINPFTFVENQVILLDTVAQLDDCALFKQQHTWKINHFPKEFGKQEFEQEARIRRLDEISGASLKFSMLNEKGTIYSILGGGGASIIYLDMIANLGKGDKIANYGESSGNPSTNESYEYAKAIIETMLMNNGKILFIVGGIANFTNVKKTFEGFIKAIREFSHEIKEKEIKIFVRRGGPYENEGLALMQELGKELTIPIHVNGPEISMPKIITIAKEAL